MLQKTNIKTITLNDGVHKDLTQIKLNLRFKTYDELISVLVKLYDKCAAPDSIGKPIIDDLYADASIDRCKIETEIKEMKIKKKALRLAKKMVNMEDKTVGLDIKQKEDFLNDYAASYERKLKGEHFLGEENYPI